MPNRKRPQTRAIRPSELLLGLAAIKAEAEETITQGAAAKLLGVSIKEIFEKMEAGEIDYCRKTGWIYKASLDIKPKPATTDRKREVTHAGTTGPNPKDEKEAWQTSRTRSKTTPPQLRRTRLRA